MDARPRHYSIEIIKMAKADQDMRFEFMDGTRKWDSSIDENNTARMKEIVADIGWPSISKVGPAASSKAWLLVQHADRDQTGFQAKCLALMKELPEGEVAKHDIAYLEDRLRSNTGRPLLYGTQFKRNKAGEWEVLPTEDMDHLDERRTKMGLGSFADNLAAIKSRYKILR